MKTNRLILILSILILTLVGCENPNSATNEPPAPKPVYKCVHCEQNTVENENTICTTCKTEKINLYKRYLGTWESELGVDGWEEYDMVSSEAKFWYTFTFSMNKISANYDVEQALVEYPFNPDTDLYFEEEVPEEWRWEGKDLYFHVNDKYYSFIDKTTYLAVSFPFVDNYEGRNTAGVNEYIKKIGSGSGDGVSYSGEYRFDSATGSQMNGSITLNDNGTWSYSGSKINVPANGGTYTVNGSEVTFSWVANNYDVSVTVTITSNNSSSTWSSNDVTFFSTFFGVVASEMTFTYTN